MVWKLTDRTNLKKNSHHDAEMASIGNLPVNSSIVKTPG